MIIVTGAAGFIGCNLVKGLNQQNRHDILCVDDLTDGKKFHNLSVCRYYDYWDKQDFLEYILQDKPFPEKIDVIFHQGACSDTMEWDGAFMMKNNYEYTKQLFHYCQRHKIPFIYASSAAVYGGSVKFDDHSQDQFPLNVYGYSKWLFDQYLSRHLDRLTAQVVGLRYFNVYGPHENHKGKMASVAFHLMNQLRDNGIVKLFEGNDGYGDGEQVRDFVFVEDAVAVNLWFWKNPKKSGIFNCGTGKARSFNAIAETLIRLHGSGQLEYIPFPEKLKGAYQSFTQADVTKLHQAGYSQAFTPLEEGLEKYYEWFKKM